MMEEKLTQGNLKTPPWLSSKTLCSAMWCEVGPGEWIVPGGAEQWAHVSTLLLSWEAHEYECVAP